MSGTVVRRLTAEFLGTGLLLCAVIGSGIMAVRMADGNDAVALLANTAATGAILYVMISLLGPVSGAHFNPAVTLVFALRREIGASLAAAYAAVQIAGGDAF
ncbi:MAG: aquaporin, partial [Proteobacteria bacterium]|nr:aquaporin [Pseudomonadota bacterium]